MWLFIVFCFKQKTAYDVRISDWSSDVCSSDLRQRRRAPARLSGGRRRARIRHAQPRQDAPRHRRRSRQRRGAGWGRMAGALFAGLRARPDAPRWASAEIGQASCRELGCKDVYISGVGVLLKKNNKLEIFKLQLINII